MEEEEEIRDVRTASEGLLYEDQSAIMSRPLLHWLGHLSNFHRPQTATGRLDSPG